MTRPTRKQGIEIARDLSDDASVEFAGAVLRPHAFMMKKDDRLTEAGESVLRAVKKAGHDLIKEGAMTEETLDGIIVPLIGEDELRDALNRMV